MNIQNLINMLLQQNPQLQNIIQQFANPQMAKEQVMSMLNNGQISDSDITTIKNLSKQFGFEKEMDSILNQLDLSKVQHPKKNRW